MSRRVQKYAVQQQKLRDATPSLHEQIMHHCGIEFLDCVCECVKNVLKGNVPRSSSQKQNLSRHRKQLRKLSSKKTLKKKKIEIIQRGGFLGALITPILSILGGLLGSNGAS